MARQDDELDLEKLRREVDTLTQQVGGKPNPPGTTTRLPPQEQPKKKRAPLRGEVCPHESGRGLRRH